MSRREYRKARKKTTGGRDEASAGSVMILSFGSQRPTGNELQTIRYDFRLGLLAGQYMTLFHDRQFLRQLRYRAGSRGGFKTIEINPAGDAVAEVIAAIPLHDVLAGGLAAGYQRGDQLSVQIVNA